MIVYFEYKKALLKLENYDMDYFLDVWLNNALIHLDISSHYTQLDKYSIILIKLMEVKDKI